MGAAKPPGKWRDVLPGWTKTIGRSHSLQCERGSEDGDARQEDQCPSYEALNSDGAGQYWRI